MLIYIETHITCDFPGGGGVRTPYPPPSGSAHAISQLIFLISKGNISCGFPKDPSCYVLDTQLNKVGSSSELIYFYKQQNIIRGNYDKQGVLLF